MRLQVIDEPSHPGRPALRVRPHADVFVDAFKNRTAQLELRIDLVDCRGPLEVKRAVIFRHGVFAVGFLTHFDVTDRVTALLDVGDLGGGIVRRAVEHRHRNHGRQIVGHPAGEEHVEAAVLVAAAGVHIHGGMPRVNGGRTISRLLFAGTCRLRHR